MYALLDADDPHGILRPVLLVSANSTCSRNLHSKSTSYLSEVGADWQLAVRIGIFRGGIQQRKEPPLNTSNSLIYKPTVRRPPSKTPHQGTHNLRLHADNIRDRWNSPFLHFETLGKHFAIYLESVHCSEMQVKHHLEKLTTNSSRTFGSVRCLRKRSCTHEATFFCNVDHSGCASGV
jgi:hypothetical protein